VRDVTPRALVVPADNGLHRVLAVSFTPDTWTDGPGEWVDCRQDQRCGEVVRLTADGRAIAKENDDG